MIVGTNNYYIEISLTLGLLALHLTPIFLLALEHLVVSVHNRTTNCSYLLCISYLRIENIFLQGLQNTLFQFYYPHKGAIKDITRRFISKVTDCSRELNYRS